MIKTNVQTAEDNFDPKIGPGVSMAVLIRTTDDERRLCRWVQRQDPTRAFTLTECLVACVILTLVTIAISSALTAAHANSNYALHSLRAVRLAEELTERILAVPYGSIASFNGYQEAPGQVRDIASSFYPNEYQVFRRQVTTAAGTQSVGGLGGSVAGTTVTVTVTDAKGTQWTLTRFIPQ